MASLSMRRSPGRTVESATKGLYRCLKTNNAVDWVRDGISPGFRQSVEGLYEAAHLAGFR